MSDLKTKAHSLLSELVDPQAARPSGGLHGKLAIATDRAIAGFMPDDNQSRLFCNSTDKDLVALCNAAALIRDSGKGRVITFSPKVFIPLTKLCRDFCGYCTFRQSPRETDTLFMNESEVLDIAFKAQALGCTEALFTLGERPETRYKEAANWLGNHGYKTTLEYLTAMSSLVLQKTSLVPHGNPGTMSRREMSSLHSVNISMGVMLEILSEKLCLPGGAHHLAPSKWPRARLKTLQIAGQLGIPFTTGILIGIGETRDERIESLLAIRKLHLKYDHIQEVIIQNFRAKPNTPMEYQPDASTNDLLWTVAVARIILGKNANIQVPPNLSSQNYHLFLLAGINDWGGVSPLTIDYVNPESPWPLLSQLRRRTEDMGFELKPRLPIYPDFLVNHAERITEVLRDRAKALTDSDGFVKGGVERYANN